LADGVNGFLGVVFALRIFAERPGDGREEFCGRTRLFALDFAEVRDLLDFGFVKVFANALIIEQLTGLYFLGRRIVNRLRLI
jgi:hypothetical protein